MLRSMFSSISGLRAHQTMMDVTGNNISNVNTAGFKSSQTVFQDTLSQLLQGAAAPNGAQGGTNPSQVGLGTRVAGISNNFSQGAAQTTGNATDLMISGDGFFMVNKGAETLYTRSGAFSFDSTGRLTTTDGSTVQGWQAVDGAVNTNAPVGDVTLPIGVLLAPEATEQIVLGGNLPGDGTSTNPVVLPVEVFDEQGNARTVTASFTQTSATTWDATYTDGGTVVTQGIVFDGAGANPTPNVVTLGGITLDISGMTGFAGTSSAVALSQDGSGGGTLQSYSIGPDGALTGVFSNGGTQTLGMIALATFANPMGLEKAGGSTYRLSANSGGPQVGAAGNGRGTLSGGMLEMSNVDLAQEFTNLIIAQRGFQANSRVITASDELLQDLVNMKR